MPVRNLVLRRATALVARAGAVASAAVLTLGVWSTVSPRLGGAAAIDAGPAQVIAPLDGKPGAGAPLSSGGSATEFSLLLPPGAACTGDSANDGYRVQSYVVPSGVDPGGLSFDSNGPVPNGTRAALRQPLYDRGGSGWIDQQTANASTPGGPGPVVGIPAFTFAVYAPGDLPAGTYNVGIACTRGPASPTQLDRFWNVRLVFAVDGADAPAGVTWRVAEPAGTTTTTTVSATTTTVRSTSTTTALASTTTSTTVTATSGGSASTNSATAAPGSTNAGATGSDPDALGFAAAVGGAGGGGPAFGSTVVLAAELAATGWSASSLALWGVLLLVLGRMAVLLGRMPPPVTSPTRR